MNKQTKILNIFQFFLPHSHLFLIYINHIKNSNNIENIKNYNKNNNILEIIGIFWILCVYYSILFHAFLTFTSI